ncbi:MAG: MATE family efflux transporter [Cardiobacteriales bacterium]|nr:MAG: MATE family efflux transporter [Cardiobacteriales bacterium]
MVKNIYWQELKGTLALGLPLIFTQLLGQAQQVIDTVMAGQHDALTLSAVSIASQMFALVYLLMIGIGVAISATISRYHGKNDRIHIRRSFQQSVWLMFFLTILAFMLICLSAFVPDLIGSEENIAREAKKYLLTLAPCGAILILSMAPRFFLEGMAFPRPNIIIQLWLLPLNVFLNWAFLSGWSIFPALGAQGMAIATAICYLLYTVLIFTQLFRDVHWRSLRLFRHFSPPQMVQMSALLRIGIPISLAIIMEAALFFSIGLIVSRSNVINTGANQIALNFSSLIFMVPLGLSSALTVRVSNAIGRQDLMTTRIRSISGIALSAGLMLCSAIMMLLFGDYIANFYSDDAQIIPIAEGILGVVAIFQIFDGIQVSAAGVLRGMHDTKIAMIYAFIGYWLLGFPLGLFFAYVLGYGIYGLWSGIACGLFVNATLGTRRVWQKIKPNH